MRILQLSDFHILTAATARLRGVPTAACLSDVLEVVRSDYSDSELLVMTGDLAAYGEAESYDLVGELCTDVLPRAVMLPGNHDGPELLRQVFPQCVAAEAEGVTFVRDVGTWRLIGLNSHIPGEVGGELSESQLAALRRELTEGSPRPTLVFLHHPPVSVQSAWLDRIMLRNSAALADLLVNASHVRGIFCGHVHQEFVGQLAGIPVYTAPSTAIQFAPRTEELRFDPLPPGFRVIDFDGDNFCTYVVRLPELKYPPESDG